MLEGIDVGSQSIGFQVWPDLGTMAASWPTLPVRRAAQS
jgi:hypothetical protein